MIFKMIYLYSDNLPKLKFSFFLFSVKMPFGDHFLTKDFVSNFKKPLLKCFPVLIITTFFSYFIV